jgi:hypothetical protein
MSATADPEKKPATHMKIISLLPETAGHNLVVKVGPIDAPKFSAG